jgi:hypothetical protein
MGYELLPLLVTVETLSVKLHHEQEDAEAKLDGEQLKLSSSCWRPDALAGWMVTAAGSDWWSRHTTRARFTILGETRRPPPVELDVIYPKKKKKKTKVSQLVEQPEKQLAAVIGVDGDAGAVKCVELRGSAVRQDGRSASLG